MSILASAALFFSFSRSAYGAALMLLVYFFWRERKEKKRLLFPFAILATLTMLAILFASLFFVRATAVDIPEQRSITERGIYIAEAFSVIRSVPILGVGAGNYTTSVCKEHIPGWQCQPVHNIFLLFFAELGIVGICFFFAILFYAKKNMAMYKNISSEKKELFVLVSLVLSILGLVDHYLYTSFSGVMLISILYGAVLCPHFLHRQQK